MPRIVFALFLFAAGLPAVPLPSPLPTFSAEFSYYADGERDWGKAYVTNERERLEVQKGRVVWLADWSKESCSN